LLNEPEGRARRVETVLNPILAAQMTEHLGASPYERQGDRHGVRPRTLSTRVGPVTLQVPQTRDGSFSPEIFKRYPRSEKAFVLALMGWWSTASRPVK
jgi:transposase-like protein